MGEVLFMNNSITGLIVLIAVFMNSWLVATCMVLGIIVSTITAKLFKLNNSAISNGIYGYNAVLLQIKIA